jgi:tRNA (guanosine-2'-O-)-methyltransferase
VPTRQRIEKIKRLLSQRQPDLRVVLEGVAIAHNASAVIRTCDAAGVLHLHLVSPNPEFIHVNKAISMRAEKWVEIHLHRSLAECLGPLRRDGLKIAVTHLGRGAAAYTELEYAQPLAIVFGSEAEGVSREALDLADYRVQVPMFGMVQSLNLSVSVGIVLFEAVRQRLERGYYRRRLLSDKDYEAYLRKWLSGEAEGESGQED